MSLIFARGLSKSYERRLGLFRGNAPVRALEGVDLDIAAGSTLALVGETGSGKSTLARCLALLESPDSGEILYEGRVVAPAAGRPPASLRRGIQLVFQDPASSLNPRFTAVKIVEEPMLVQGIGTTGERPDRSLDLLERVGLPRSVGGRLPQELSGGQRQRLAIARALVLEPKLLILDEALSSLDLSIQAQLVNLLLDLQAARSLTYLFISHDLGLAARFADEIAVMQRGRIVERGPTRSVFRNARHPHTRVLLDSIPSVAGAL